MNDHKLRWVFGPVGNGVHAAAEYSVSCEFPISINGAALAYCKMNAHQIAAARKDPRLTVLPSMHAAATIPDNVADHHSAQGIKRGMRMHDMLMELSKLHSNFEPEY